MTEFRGDANGQAKGIQYKSELSELAMLSARLLVD